MRTVRVSAISITAAACAAALASCSGKDTTVTGLPLSVELFEGESTELSVSFTLVYTDADAAAFMVLSGNFEPPTAENIIEKGAKAEAPTATYLIEGLYPSTEYTVYAAAVKGTRYSEVAELTLVTFDGPVPDPSLTLAKGRATENTLTFTATPSYASDAAFVLLAPSDPVPDAAAVLAGPNHFPPSGTSEIRLSALRSSTEYVVAAAVARGDMLSAVDTLHMTTSEATRGGILYESLQGRWNASLEVLDAFGGSGTTEIRWDVDIVTGIDDTTRALYSEARRLCCVGFLGERVWYPDELRLYPYWQAHPDEADFDWGPKWFLEIPTSGDVTVPPSVPSYFSGDAAWTMSYVSDRLDFFGGIAHKGIGFYDKPIAVAVSENMDTIRVEPWIVNDPETGGELTAYPSQCSLQSSGEIGFYDIPAPEGGGTVTTIGAGPLVLTRAAAPQSARRPSPRSAAAPSKTESMPAAPFAVRQRVVPSGSR